MLNLFLDLIFTSLTGYSSSFIVYTFSHKKTFLNVLIISIFIAFYTLNIFNLVLVLIIYYLNQYLLKYISNKYILAFISYLLLFNINISLTSFIIFIISVLIIYFNPYN